MLYYTYHQPGLDYRPNGLKKSSFHREITVNFIKNQNRFMLAAIAVALLVVIAAGIGIYLHDAGNKAMSKVFFDAMIGGCGISMMLYTIAEYQVWKQKKVAKANRPTSAY